MRIIFAVLAFAAMAWGQSASYLDLVNGTAPAAPAAGRTRVYSTGGQICSNFSGEIVCLGGTPGAALTLAGAEQAAPTVTEPTCYIDSTTHLFTCKNGSDTVMGSIINLPANASGYLNNDGAGNLSWAAVQGGGSATRSVTITMTGSGAGGLLTTDDDLPVIMYNGIGEAMVISSVSCKTDSAGNTRLQLTNDGNNMFTNNAGAGFDCTSTRGAPTINPSYQSVASTKEMGSTFVSVDGAAHWISITYVYTPTTANRQYTFVIQGSGASGVLVDTDDQPSIWYNNIGMGVTLTGVSCKADSVTATRIQLQRDDGTPANILTDNAGLGLDCSSTRGAGTLDNTEKAIANTNAIDFVLVDAGDVNKWVAITLSYTVD